MGRLSRLKRYIAGQIACCDRKLRFPTQIRAEVYTDRRNLRLRPYSCPICGQWHLTKGGAR